MPDVYYDDQKRPIATSVGELIIYFQSLGGVSVVQNVVYTLPCPMLALIKVSTSAVVPKFIYKNGFSPYNKIYMKALPQNTLNVTPLCNGTTFNNIVPPPVIGTLVSVAIDFYTTEDGLTTYTNEIDIPLNTES